MTKYSINPDMSVQVNAIEKILFIIFFIGIILNIYIFLLPYNTIADEEEYLNEVFSFAAGEPSGWNIRSFVYPSFLSISILISRFFNLTSLEDLTLAVRLANWIVSWGGVYLTYLISKKIFGKTTAILAVIFLSFSWFWILSSKRVMMDIPSTVFLLLAIYFLLKAIETKNIIMTVVFSSLAFFTKFQLSIAILPIAILLILKSQGRKEKLHTSLIATTTAIIMIAIYAITDLYVYGSPFTSIVEFINYNFLNSEEFSAKYGECESALYYITELPLLFSYIFPLFLAAGLGFSLHYEMKVALPLFFIIVFYIAAMSLICHKQIRYLIQISPILSMFAAFGLVSCGNFIKQKMDNMISFRKVKANNYLTLVFIVCNTLFIIYSFIPRNDIKQITNLKEACSEFVYETLLTQNDHHIDKNIMLIAPCGTPPFFLKNMVISYGDLGVSPQTRLNELEKIKNKLPYADIAIMQHNSEPEKFLLENWGGIFRTYKVSKYETYIAYIKK